MITPKPVAFVGLAFATPTGVHGRGVHGRAAGVSHPVTTGVANAEYANPPGTASKPFFGLIQRTFRPRGTADASDSSEPSANGSDASSDSDASSSGANRTDASSSSADNSDAHEWQALPSSLHLT
ncbi:hypothetical protein C8Q74DRAFT_1371919 [Fomes fomentarius]|nr:hypothetical protein C8Q74DRAFT_1371919 [Fomes fomentarius]